MREREREDGRKNTRERENTSKTLIPINGSLTRPDPNGRAKGAPAGAMRTRRCTRAGYLDENATDIPPPIEWPIKMKDFEGFSSSSSCEIFTSALFLLFLFFFFSLLESSSEEVCEPRDAGALGPVAGMTCFRSSSVDVNSISLCVTSSNTCSTSKWSSNFL